MIDLTHEIPPFDVRAGSHTLVRAVPYLGSGVVLAVVDPGVGTSRRAVALEAARPDAPLSFVGPDNGLLVAAAEAAAGGTGAPVARAGAAPGAGPGPAAGPGRRGRRHTARGRTFDGRDVFAPAAAALCVGAALDSLGEPVDPASLVRLIAGVVDTGRLDDGRACLRAEVTWVDRYGNLQLAATESDARAVGLPAHGQGHGRAGVAGAGPGPPRRRRARSRPPWCPTACTCIASTRSPTWHRESSGCWSTPTATWPSWPGRRRPRRGSTSRRASSSSWPGDGPSARAPSSRSRFGAGRRALGTIRRDEPRATLVAQADPRSHRPPAPGVPEDPGRAGAQRHHDRVVRATRRRGAGERGQGAQGPVAARLVRDEGHRLRPGDRHRADRPRPRRRRGLVGGHRRHRQSRPRPDAIRPGSPPAAVTSPRSSTSTPGSSARTSGASRCATWTSSPR